ncbi:Similar to Tmbim1: Protein lifeguard 3 (Mus musculus) [Cotesia congregata]|uniref:Similar to Tmbim1: Protein lifeguard 3 (Mus musculus) n=1 Tax=Cotesia congregata TaxID=51543 RepID=A0A8J2H0E7_COTCN|nr:Similar to Tmbim1: Protein lifeguard 3 (Mus musculus) [Cotesia congregata]
MQQPSYLTNNFQNIPASILSLDQNNVLPDSSTAHIPVAAGGPPLLPHLVRGQNIQSGPYTITVTNSMVIERERQNQEIYRFWLAQQRRNLGGTQTDEDYFAEFKNSKLRRNFITKVFFILFLQFLFTALYISFFMFHPPARDFINRYWYLWVIAMTVFLCSYCSISITDCGRRQSGWGITLLLLLTLAESHLAAYISIRFNVELVLITFDFTMWTGLLSIVGVVALMSIIIITVTLMYTKISVAITIFGAIGALIFSLYLYFDVQTIMGGRKIQISPDEVIFATTQLYVDIIGLYRYLLLVIGGSTRSY